MKPETDPITGEEWLIRLAWGEWCGGNAPCISPRVFQPREGRHPDTDGISLFRQSCVSDPTDALRVIPEGKRSGYWLVRIPVTVLAELKLTVRPSQIDEVPGHVVIPELNIAAYNDKSNKAFFTATQLRLAEVASEHIVRRPNRVE
jgi:hypothetical protein